jgi:hypothetical protein
MNALNKRWESNSKEISVHAHYRFTYYFGIIGYVLENTTIPIYKIKNNSKKLCFNHWWTNQQSLISSVLEN